MSTLYCPRCDRRLTPDHRCMGRRLFLGALAGLFAGMREARAMSGAEEAVALAVSGMSNPCRFDLGSGFGFRTDRVIVPKSVANRVSEDILLRGRNGWMPDSVMQYSWPGNLLLAMGHRVVDSSTGQSGSTIPATSSHCVPVALLQEVYPRGMLPSTTHKHLYHLRT